jgi:hypothetical protein
MIVAFRALGELGLAVAYGMAVTSAASHHGPGRDQALALVRACGVEPTTFMKYGRCECCGLEVLRRRCPNCYRDLCPSCTSRPNCPHSHEGTHATEPTGAETK